MLLHTFIPSSSLTLRIIFTHISVILLNAGCSRQMSLRILITRFLTLIPVSYIIKDKKKLWKRSTTKTPKTEITSFGKLVCIEVQWQLSTNRWHFKPTKRMNFSWTLVNISMTTATTISMQPVSSCWAQRGTMLACMASFHSLPFCTVRF